MRAVPVLDLDRELPGMTEAACPVTWAHGNLVLLGQGGTASVFAHPSREDVVVRVTDYPDGWFVHARADAGPHVPRADGFAYVEGEEGVAFVGVSERLTSADPDDVGDPVASGHVRTAATLARAVVVHGSVDGAVGARALCRDEVADLRSAWPTLVDMLSAPGGRRSDLREGNWLLRGRCPVLNDPVRAMTPEEETAFKERFAIGTRTSTPAP